MDTDAQIQAPPRKIIHVDMDCFFAAVEIRDDPSLADKPVAVGGAADRRGVISTCNYVARKFGIHSAMSTAYAMRLCPELIVLPGRMNHYKEVSGQIRKIFSRYTSIIEPLSLDEAYLDVTDCNQFQGSATMIAEDIRRAIREELRLTASAGIAPNKFLAKVCSDENKPDGQRVVTPDEVDDFVRRLPLKKIPGVGKVTVSKLESMGLRTCDDARRVGEARLAKHFGSMGRTIYRRAWGIDDRAINTTRVRKSLSVERTFPQDLMEIEEAAGKIPELVAELKQRLARADARPVRNQQVKLKFQDFTTTTIERATQTIDDALFLQLLPQAWSRGEGKGIRLLGLGVSFSDDAVADQNIQLRLFD
ncbi:MAG: DNA polymerase IV [Pseudomonadales bacterium]|nr:DNA polymerase IV [Pseudomonadales bacterium]